MERSRAETDRLRTEVSELRRAHDDRVKELERERTSQMELLRRAHTEALSQLDSDYMRIVEQLKQPHHAHVTGIIQQQAHSPYHATAHSTAHSLLIVLLIGIQ